MTKWEYLVGMLKNYYSYFGVYMIARVYLIAVMRRQLKKYLSCRGTPDAKSLKI